MNDSKLLPEAHLADLNGLASWYWWHTHRIETALWLARRFLRTQAPLRYLDVGCGPGATTRLIARGLSAGRAGAPGAAEGADFDPRMQEFCEKNGVAFRLLKPEKGFADLPAGPFDLITLLDVLEHVKDPRPLLERARGRLAPGGLAIATVPAFQFLFSDWDARLGHHRRYRLRDLRPLFSESGFEVVYGSYLFGFAFLPALLSRRLGRPGKAGAEFPAVSPALNAALKFAGKCERGWLRLAGLPLGTSVVLAAKKA